MIKFIIVLAVAYLIGAFGWAQIIGSLQNIKTSKMYLLTIVIWLAILGGAAYLAISVFDETFALCIAYGITLVQVLSAGKIE